MRECKRRRTSLTHLRGAVNANLTGCRCSLGLSVPSPRRARDAYIHRFGRPPRHMTCSYPSGPTTICYHPQSPTASSHDTRPQRVERPAAPPAVLSVECAHSLALREISQTNSDAAPQKPRPRPNPRAFSEPHSPLRSGSPPLPTTPRTSRLPHFASPPLMVSGAGASVEYRSSVSSGRLFSIQRSCLICDAAVSPGGGPLLAT